VHKTWGFSPCGTFLSWLLGFMQPALRTLHTHQGSGHPVRAGAVDALGKGSCMGNRKSIAFLGILIASGAGSLLGPGNVQALAATPTFTVSATNVTMSSSGTMGTGATKFTVASVGGYSGSVALYCAPLSAPSGARQPTCGGSVALAAFPVAPNARPRLEVCLSGTSPYLSPKDCSSTVALRRR
jgi:hypothetical protein